MIRITWLVLLATLAVSTARECNLDCPVDAPCTFGSANYDHNNALGLDDQSGGMHCDCPAGWTGILCDHKYESCEHNHDCFHGGECIPGLLDQYGNDQLFCDCENAVASDGTRYVGKYCETPFDKICSSDPDHFCVNGGECNPDYQNDGLACNCPDGWEGFHCEFKAGTVPDCTLNCHNDGVCIVGVRSPAETALMKRTWSDEEIHDHMRCICPEGTGGPRCNSSAERCGEDDLGHYHHCYHGGTCVETTIFDQFGESRTTYNCDCTTAEDDAIYYAGLYCENPATVYCSEDDANLFCTNGGSCKDNPIMGCDCREGYTGHKCELNVDESLSNGGTNNDDNDAVECDGIFCFNGGECVQRDFVLDNGTPGTEMICDCSFTDLYAGDACQYKASHLCSDADDDDVKFCVNGGTCNNIDNSCDCAAGWTGENCEIHTKDERTNDDEVCGDHVCFNGGRCVETTLVNQDGTTRTEEYCDCTNAYDENHLYAGTSCQYKSTHLCTQPEEGASLEGMYFCTNHGRCQDNVLAGCRCHDGFSGFSCEFDNFDEDPDDDDQDSSSVCGDLTCHNGGTCVTSILSDLNGGRTTVQHCDCSTAHTDSVAYAGEQCQYPSTTFCTAAEEGEGLGSTLFCVNGGTCGSPIFSGCDCPTGWSGFKCEYAVDPDDLISDQDDDLANAQQCGENICYNGGTCKSYQEVDDDGELQTVEACDCSSTATDEDIYAGDFCQFRSTSVCQLPEEGDTLAGALFCVNHGVCNDNPLLGCECPTGFTGTMCEFIVEDDQHADQGEPCGDGAYCYNGGTCVTTKILHNDGTESVQKTCDCTSAGGETDLYAGESCEHKSSTFCSHPQHGDSVQGLLFCVNGGTCKDDPLEGCDCPPEWTGFFCEIESDVSDLFETTPPIDDTSVCDDLVCLNGGTCVTTRITGEDGNHHDENHCDCSMEYTGSAMFAGPQCEYKSTVFCNLADDPSDLAGVMFCVNGGACGEDSVAQACECPLAWTGYHCEIPAVPVEEETSAVPCGDGHCKHGGTCVMTQNNGETEFSCDCSTAYTRTHLFDGPSCQYKSTTLCTEQTGDTLAGVEFCVNDGACRDDNTCHCHSGYTGDRCEITIYDGDDSEDSEDDDANDDLDFSCHLQCHNGGHCAKGAKDLGSLTETVKHVDHLNKTYDETYFEHCVCPDGFTGLHCQHEVEYCGEEEHACLHGSTCVESNGKYSCDCSSADATIAHVGHSSFAGDSCEHPATDICIQGADYPGRPKYFCVNHGMCNAYVSEGEADPGCECTDGWTGPHCEISTNQSSLPAAQYVNEGMEVALIIAIAVVVVVSFLLCVTVCVRRRSSSKEEPSTRRRPYMMEQAASRTSNLAPHRNASMANSNKSFSSSTDPMVTGLTLAPDEEPEPYEDEPMEPFQDEPIRPYQDDPNIDGYRDEEPVLVNVGPPRDEDGNELHNVEVI